MEINGEVAGQLEKRCLILNKLFNQLMGTNSRVEKESIVNSFRARLPQMNKDLDYCFEVLAGKHKLGYTYILTPHDKPEYSEQYKNYTIHKFIDEVLKPLDATDNSILLASLSTPYKARTFIMCLVNREFKLGYSNKDAMITHYSPMLAKKYQDTYKPEQTYFIQEKLDGNRCIAVYNNDEESWQFWSRSGKQLKVNFDMNWADTNDIFDGEVMTLEHAGSRDFNRTSGAINGKYTDKSGLHYFIYDLVDEKRTYRERKKELDNYVDKTSLDCTILPVLDEITVYPNHDYNWKLDEWLDVITSKGGEGIMLRDPDAYYQCGKRSDGLLKYKKTQTMDLRIVDWNEGNGKYAGAIGSFNCQTDDGDIIVNVAGMPDDMRFSDPNIWIGKIIEVAYFDISVNSVTGQKSLRFPRLKKIRDDKNTTSIY